MKKELYTPIAIFLGSIVISITILVSNGIIKLKDNQTTAQPPADQTLGANTDQKAPVITQEMIKQTFEKSLVKFGKADQKLVLIEIADPSCPYCSIAGGKNPELNKQAGTQFLMVSDGGSYVAPVPEMEKLVKAGKAAYAYLYTPGHGNGEMGTKALYCAYENNKYWEVNDLLYGAEGYDLMNNQVKNDTTKSQQVADFLKSAIDPKIMKSCLDSGKYDGNLQSDKAAAGTLGIGGTPGFFVNTTLYAGAYSWKDMESTVNSFLN